MSTPFLSLTPDNPLALSLIKLYLIGLCEMHDENKPSSKLAIAKLQKIAEMFEAHVREAEGNLDSQIDVVSLLPDAFFEAELRSRGRIVIRDDWAEEYQEAYPEVDLAMCRDQVSGAFFHPNFPWVLIGPDESLQPYLDAMNLEAKTVDLETDVGPGVESARMLQSEGSGDYLLPWVPSRPEGERWVLMAIYDNEDGGTALWARKREFKLNPAAAWPFPGSDSEGGAHD